MLVFGFLSFLLTVILPTVILLNVILLVVILITVFSLILISVNQLKLFWNIMCLSKLFFIVSFSSVPFC
jgi:hypothetical protein